MKLAGIEDLGFHDLRHEAVSQFFEMGLSVPEVTFISGIRITECWHAILTRRQAICAAGCIHAIHPPTLFVK